MKFPKEWKRFLQEDIVIHGIYRGRYIEAKKILRDSSRLQARSRLRWKYKKYITKKYIKRGLI